MTAAIVWVLPALALILRWALWARSIRRQLHGTSVLAEHWASVADRRGSERDHLAWELRQVKRLLEQTSTERDKALRMLLTHLDRQQKDQAAVIAVCLHRIAVLTGRVTDLESSAAADRSVERALAELVDADTRRTA